MKFKKLFVDYYAKGIHKRVSRTFREQKRLLGGAQVETIVDLGAHVGSAAWAYRRLFPTARIFCFEPFPASFEMLAHNFAQDPSVICTRAAAAAEHGSHTLFVNESTAANSLFESNSEVVRATGLTALQNVGSVPVETIKLDDFCAEQEINTVDILKLDIQGGELEALRGAEALLQREAISLIYSEVEFVPFYQGQPLFHDISSHLAKSGFRFLNLFNVRRQNGQMLWGDAIFIGPRLEMTRRS